MRKILFLSLLIFSSCLSLSSYQPQVKYLEPLEFGRFKDIPVPRGFKFIQNDSMVTEAGNFRVGSLVFKGSASPSKITKFYKENMTKRGWELLNIIESKQTIMNFRSNSEICTVRFDWRRGGGVLIISVSPYSKEEKAELKDNL